MVSLKSQQDIEGLRKAGRKAAKILSELSKLVQPGISTADMNALAEKLIEKQMSRPAFKGYRGYPAVLCTSVNEEVVHGIPSRRRLAEGDILSLDLGIIFNGYYGDVAVTLPVGKISEEDEKLIRVTREALDRAIEKSGPGSRIGDISSAIQEHAEAAGFSVVRKFVGHGIGKALHEDPQVPNFGCSGTGFRLKPGLVICFEPMVNAGTGEVEILSDGWTAVTADRKKSAHFEHMIAISDNGPEVLTRL